MSFDVIQKAKEEITSYFEDNYEGNKFTVKFNGEFFIVNSHKRIATKRDFKPTLYCVSDFILKDNKIFLKPADKWLKESVLSIQESGLSSTNLLIYSQVIRLTKQIEFELAGDDWDDNMFCFVRDILYMLHTKSKSIRLNIVKRCAKEYNKMQRLGVIPIDIVKGYKNALCQIKL